MIIYIESNFVLEIALEQEQHLACHSILADGESGSIKLVLPAFSIAEPYQTLVRRFRERKGLLDRLNQELNLLGRTESYRAQIADMRQLSGLLAASQDDEEHRLHDAMERILSIAEVIPLEANVVRTASIHAYGLDTFDGLVFASIASHIAGVRGEKCFLTRNSKDFSDPELAHFLQTNDCRIFYDFVDAERFIRSRVGHR